MTNEFEQAALAYHKSSLEWQQRYNIAIAERNDARRALRIAAGVVSTMKVWSDKHPQDAYDWIVAQAQTDASRAADAEVQP
jgi:uncharacterized protein YlxP (DUF503 family)